MNEFLKILPRATDIFSMSSNAKFVVSHLDEQMGPFTEVELKAKWHKGELLPIDYVFDETKQDWILLSERFPWSSGKNEPPAPPAPGEVTVKRKRPPEFTQTAFPIPAEFLTLNSAAVAATATAIVPAAVPVAAAVSVPVAAAVPVSAAMSVPAGVPVTGVAPVPEVAAPPPVKVRETKGADVHLVGGQGEIDLPTLEPGPVEFSLQQANGLKLQNPFKIQVHAAQPAALQWKVPERQIAGADAEIHVTAIDEGGHVCRHYSEKFVIRVEGLPDHEIAVALNQGEASVRVQHTKAEAWVLSLHYSGNLKLQMPDSKTLVWEAGAATQLVLDGPQEYTTGQPLKIKVKAVDSFGNLANHFQGTITLEIKAG